MKTDESDKLHVSMNSILDDVTVIQLSVEMLEIRHKQYMNEETKRYFKNIKNHCNDIVKTVHKNNKIITQNF